MKIITNYLNILIWLSYSTYLTAFDPQSDFSSAILKGNKIYCLSNKFFEDGRPRLSVYTLNNQNISSIIESSSDLNLNDFPPNYLPEFLDIKTGDPNQLYFLGGQKYLSLKTSRVKHDHLLSTYDLGSSKMTYHNQHVMKQPLFHKFPQYYYTSTPVEVRQSDGSTHTVIYIFGGYKYSSKLQKPALTNLFYSYNINTKEWKDLNESVNRDDIPPLGGHTAVLVENRYIYMLGGLTWPKGNYSHQVAKSASGPPVTSLKKIIYYDTQTNSWTKKDAYSTAHNDLIDKPLFGFTGNYHDNNVVVFGGFINNNTVPDKGAYYNTLFARYNVKNNQWSFTSIADDSDKKIKYPFIGRGASVIYNNQLILIDGTRAFKSEFKDRLYAIDLKTDRLVNNLKLIESDSSKPSNNGWFYKLITSSFH